MANEVIRSNWEEGYEAHLPSQKDPSRVKRGKASAKKKSKTRAGVRKRELRQLRKDQILAYKGGECAVTGSSGDLDFHHIIPSEMAFRIRPRTCDFSWKKLVAEADKCVLLCKPIHTLIHAEVARLMATYENTSAAYRTAMLDYHTKRETERVIRFGEILRFLGFTRYGIIKYIRHYYTGE